MVIHASTKGLFIVNIHENNHNNLTHACKIFFNQRDLQLGSPVFHNETFQCHHQRSTMIKIDQHHYETCNGPSPLGSPVFHKETLLSRMGFRFRKADTATCIIVVVPVISKVTSLFI